MKKLFKKLHLPIVLMLILSILLSGCVMSLTCISHIDRDRNGECDNCGIAMEVPREDIEKIEVTTLPTKTYYGRNETLDVTGGKITVTYNDGTPDEEIDMTAEGVTIVAPGMGVDGKKSVQVKYGGHSATFVIEVGSARFTVSFDLGYEGGEMESQFVTQNSLMEEPAAPEREGYSFLGWFTDEACTQRFDFALTPVTADMTLYAGWAQVYMVTYDANYDGGADKTAESVNGRADTSIRPDDRDGWHFTGWYSDPECTQAFDPNTILTGDITLYAGWVSSDTEMITVTFDPNYEGAEATTQQVPSGSPVNAPATPERANVTEKGHQASGFTFGGWYTDPACTTEYDFSAAVTEAMTLYAKWTGEYVFEAEHIDLSGPDGNGLQGMGASGGSVGPNMVDSVPPDYDYLIASNGYYLTYLYKTMLEIEFVIESDRAVSDATIVIRVSAETVGYALSPNRNDGTTENGTLYSMFMITLNDSPIEYPTIEMEGGRPQFEDFTLTVNATLKEGTNVIKMIVANDHGMGGTMQATAPVIDCIKVTTSADLTWNPIVDNEKGQ